MSNIIGKFQGKKVFKVTFPEYVNSRLYKNEDYIFLVDGELMRLLQATTAIMTMIKSVLFIKFLLLQ